MKYQSQRYLKQGYSVSEVVLEVFRGIGVTAMFVVSMAVVLILASYIK